MGRNRHLDCGQNDRNLVPVGWADAPPADGQFWQAEAQVRDGAFVVTKADGTFVPPPKAKLSVSESSRDEASPAIPKLKLTSCTHSDHLKSYRIGVIAPLESG